MDDDESLLADVPLWLLVIVAIGLAVAILTMSGCSTHRKPKPPIPPAINLCGYGTKSAEFQQCVQRLNGVI